MKKCKKCLGEVPFRAKKCQHCGSKIRLTWQELTKAEKTVSIGIVVLIVMWISGAFSGNKNVGCNVPNAPIQYSILEETFRKSDVEGIWIKECYILISKAAPNAEELKAFSTVLGKKNENIEFRIFDDKKAYEIYFQKYQAILSRGGKDSEIPKSDWDIVDKHWLADYLKADTNLRNNYLLLQSNIYPRRGLENKISISN